MKVTKTIFLLAAISMIAFASLHAQTSDLSPIGLWKNVDETTGKPRAMIRISDANGKLEGKIEQVFPTPSEAPNPKCAKCEGVLKDAPVIGLTILRGMVKDGDQYGGGQILDPDNGKTYSSQLRLIEGGKKLNVRGYIGSPILGRSQIWIRQE